MGGGDEEYGAVSWRNNASYLQAQLEAQTRAILFLSGAIVGLLGLAVFSIFAARFLPWMVKADAQADTIMKGGGMLLGGTGLVPMLEIFRRLEKSNSLKLLAGRWGMYDRLDEPAQQSLSETTEKYVAATLLGGLK